MTIAADPSGFGITAATGSEVDSAHRVRALPGLAVASVASIGAGIVHAGAIGIHAEHPPLARLFVVVALSQLAVGLFALARPHRLIAAAMVVVNAIAVGGWLVTRLTGISWISGLETAEATQFTDTACALLGAIAIGGALAASIIGPREIRPPRFAVPALAVAALVVPAMFTGAAHAHSGSASASGHGQDDTTSVAATDTTAHGHDDTTSVAAADTTSVAATDTTVHGHDDGTDDSTATLAAPWPRPWDPAQPIDISGVEGVTPEQEARALTLIEQSLVQLPRYADTADAVADGYVSIGDAVTGSEHYIKGSLIQDDVILDPAAPESLVYTVQGEARILAGAMYIASARPTDDPDLVAWGGPLMQWHNHGDLCWDRDANGVAKVVGVVDDAGVCARGVNTGGANPMVHVWITPHECGVFAALEGVGAGQTSVTEAERIDKCQPEHGEHDPAATVAPVPYDPTKPIDLGGVEGVTLEQQAAAENLVAINLVRLPQWSDYRVAEAAGFISIGDGLTGREHFVQWDWIDDDVALDPDFPESLVYEPQPDGSKKLVSAMYMLPSSVELEDVPDIGGALTQWHIHDNLCYTAGSGPKVAGLTNSKGECPAPLVKHDPVPMIHVWITPHPCGPFASLEGVGAGQIAEGEKRLCDTAHGSH